MATKTCKRCGKLFEYNREVGYSEDLCGPFCDGVWSATMRFAPRLTEANRRLAEIRDELCGNNLDVVGWHLNGDLEPLDTWFEDNDWGPVPEEWKPNVRP